MPILHRRACHLCEAICGVIIETEGGEITGIRGDPDDPLSRGHICPKATALEDLHRDPDRLRTPQRRTASGWEPLGWDAAFDLVGERLRAVQRARGRQAVAAYLGNPSVHNLGIALFAPDFLRALGTKKRFSATSVDQLPQHVAAHLMFGHQLLLPIPDLDRARFLLVLGGNPAASNGSLMTAPDIRRRLRGIRERGGRFVLVDPRRTESAAWSDEHRFIRPETDALLLAALITHLFETDQIRLGRLAPAVDAAELGTLHQALAEFTPTSVAKPTGIPAAVIRGWADELARGGIVYGRIGVSTQSFGALCHWLINALNLLSGNLDEPGGVMFTRPAVNWLHPVGSRPRVGTFDRRRTRVRDLPETGGELPVAVLAEEILTPGDEQIRALVTIAGNPVLSTPNGRQVDRALGSLEFMVSVDHYLNETTRHAHVILPPASPLERPHYDAAFLGLAVRNVARWSPALFEKPADARHDWEILTEIEGRVGPRGIRARLAREARRRLGPRRMIDIALRLGPYGSGLNPLGDGLSVAKLEAHPSGIDLGPLAPRLPDGLYTEDQRIRLVPHPFLADLPRLRQRLSAGAPAGLVLIGRRHVRSNNSWMHNTERLVRGKNRCTLLVHPDDAGARDIRDGDRVVVRSRVGAIEVPAQVTPDIMPGVVCLPHGWGHDREGIRLRVAQTVAGASINDITDDQRVDPVCGTAAFSGLPVEVARG